ncbi:MAG: DUF1326 domain-containing protein [Acidobacteria bacterium]|nr:DUF1326 domain-containing protein [Acidobacteriota bacterium]
MRLSYRESTGVFCMVLLLCTSLSWSADLQKVSWKISGELEEACSCDAACPCWWDSKPTKMTCGGGETLFIEKGNYGNVRLDGLAVGLIGQSPAGKTMMESFGSWNFAYAYIDEKADADQRKALEQIAMAISGPAAPKDKMKVRYVPITRTVNGNEHHVTLGHYGEYSGHLVEGGMGSHSKITNPTGADPIRKEFYQGRTSKYVYHDAEQKWDWKDSNYMWTKFEVTSQDYENFAAAMSQKMQQMHKN